MENICKYCGKDIKKNKGAHVRNCEMNPNLTDIIKKIAIAKNQVRHQHTLKCGKCEKEYIINVTDYIFNKKEYNKFCSRSCANSRVKTEEIKNKTSEKLKTYYELNPVVKKEKTLKNKEVKCKTCNTVFIVDSKSRIRYCSNQCITYKNYKRSKNEILFHDLCLNKFNNVLSNEKIFNGWDADVILTNEKIAVLWNGNWHYKKITQKHSLKQVQNRDKIKLKEIIKCGYYPYVIKDNGKYNPTFVKEQFELFLNNYKNLVI